MVRNSRIKRCRNERFQAKLQQPKAYFCGTGLVQGDEGIRFENLVACYLLKHAQ